MHSEHYLSLRLVHEATDSKTMHWVLFGAPLVVLIVAAFFAMKNTINNQSLWQIWPRPSMKQNQVIYILAIGSIGLMGLLAILSEGWKKDELWYFYAGICVLLALYFFVLDANTKGRLFVAAVAMLGIAFLSVWLYTKTESKEGEVLIFLHKFFIGAVVAWSVLYALISWFEFFKILFDCKGVKIWAIIFFVVAILAFLGLGYYFHKEKKAPIVDLIGYFASGVALIILLIIEARDNASNSLSSLLFD